jgi:hypothetical protein
MKEFTRTMCLSGRETESGVSKNRPPCVATDPVGCDNHHQLQSHDTSAE